MHSSQSPKTTQTPPHKRPPGVVERLYVYWIFSTVVLLLALVVLVLYLCTVANRLEQIERTLMVLRESRVVEPPAQVQPTPSPQTQDSDKPQAVPRISENSHPPVTTQPTSTAYAEETPNSVVAPLVVDIPPESEITALLDRAVARGVYLPFVIDDRSAADAVLETAQKYVNQAKWSGKTWSRLAVLARLMSHLTATESFARRAFKADDPLTDYAEVSARILLWQGHAREAHMHAEHFAEQSGGSPAARLLLARVWLALDDPAAADELLTSIDNPTALTEHDRLGLARAYYTLHRWDNLAGVMATLSSVPNELEAERNFLRAVALIQKNERLVEALGILDYLREHLVDAREPTTADETHITYTPPIPDSYEIATWRGVTLLRGGQTDSARQTLEAAAELQAVRPEAYYWLATLEIRAGHDDAAQEFLNQALDSSARFAPAWEALALIALNRGDLDATLEIIGKAIEANERRASAHFLHALAHAKANRRGPAGAALRKAFLLDPDYLNKAKQTELLERIFTTQDLEALAANPPKE